MPAWFERNHLPLGLYAAPKAALRLTPLAFKCRSRKRRRFLWWMTIALSRRRMWASIAPNPLAASAVHRRKCVLIPIDVAHDNEMMSPAVTE